MLTINNLTVGYSSRPVLQAVSLTVRPGEIVALIGPNGVGKTTLLQAINGFIPPIHGSIQVFGEDVNTLSIPERARFMAVVPQARRLPLDYTVWQTVLMGRTPYLGWLGKSRPSDQEQCRWALEQTHLAPVADRQIGELSGGEQQLVLVARALAQEAPILLLDEPTAHLDLQHQWTILGLIRKLTRQNDLAVLMSLHDLNLAAQFSDRVALLGRNKLQVIGTAQEVLVESRLSEIYRVHLHVIPHPVHQTPLVFLEGFGQKEESSIEFQ
jgi:iron complex transport system ATP-binding protein